MHVDDWDTFPTGFVLDLALELAIAPRVESSTIETALTVALPVQFPQSSKLLHHDSESFSLSIFDDMFGNVVNNV